MVGDFRNLHEVDQVGDEGEPTRSGNSERRKGCDDANDDEEGDVGRENAECASNVKKLQADVAMFEFLFQQEKSDEESAQDEEGLHPSCAGRNPARNFCQCGGVVGGIFGVRDENEQDADAAKAVEARETAVVCDLVGKLQVH